MKKKSVTLYCIDIIAIAIIMAVGVAIGVVNSQEDCKVQTGQSVAVAE